MSSRTSIAGARAFQGANATVTAEQHLRLWRSHCAHRVFPAHIARVCPAHRARHVRPVAQGYFFVCVCVLCVSVFYACVCVCVCMFVHTYVSMCIFSSIRVISLRGYVTSSLAHFHVHTWEIYTIFFYIVTWGDPWGSSLLFTQNIFLTEKTAKGSHL
jgi:hypothetical protein